MIKRETKSRYVQALCVAAALTAAGAGVAAVSAFSGGTGAALPRASRAPGVLELRVSFKGKWGSYFGPSQEWYSPRSGVFRAEGSSQGKSHVQVYDGSAWATAYEELVERQAGRPGMFRWIFARPDPLGRPGIAAVDLFLGLRRSKFIHVTSKDGGHVLDGEVSGDAIPGGPIRFRVRVVRRLTLSEATRNGLFAPPAGRLVHDLRESRPGTSPQFGEPAYWFGRQLGKAPAAATLDTWRGEHAPGASDAVYTTIYRLPASIASTVAISSRVRTYPGLGEQPPSDIRVDCYPRRPGVTVPKGAGSDEVAVVKSGERVSMTISSYTQGKHAGVRTVIVLNDAFCTVQGLVAPAVFRKALASFGQVE